MNYLFEDKNIVIVLKPAGVLSQTDEKGNPNMPAMLNEHFFEAGDQAQAYTVHRLDREAAGVMVYAKTQNAAAKLSAQVQDKTMGKEYLAVVQGILPEKEGVFKDLLFKDSGKNKSFVVKRERKGVKRASLAYRVLLEQDGKSLVHIRLHTGRTHQIRVQFSSRKFPLVGDGKYGGGGGALALWSVRLTLKHPVTKKNMLFTHLPESLGGITIPSDLILSELEG